MEIFESLNFSSLGEIEHGYHAKHMLDKVQNHRTEFSTVLPSGRAKFSPEARQKFL
jgi:hypothetical protein